MSLKASPLPLSLAPLPIITGIVVPRRLHAPPRRPNAEPEPRAGREAEMELTPTLVGIFPVGFFPLVLSSQCLGEVEWGSVGFGA